VTVGWVDRITGVWLYILLLAVALKNFGLFQYKMYFFPWMGDRIESNADTQDRQRTNSFFYYSMHATRATHLILIFLSLSISFPKRDRNLRIRLQRKMVFLIAKVEERS
jgi:hypothetical protein